MKRLAIGAAHVLLALLGTYNLWGLTTYTLEIWTSLHRQGISYLYLIVVSLIGCWWLLMSAVICFWGNCWMPKATDEFSTLAFIRPIVGAVLSLVVPSWMVSGWYIGMTWFYSFLF